MSWTSERESKLRALWKKGHTASQIAALIGETTRNAVIGKAHRLNLEARTVSKKPSTSPKAKLENDVEIKPEKLSRKAKFKALLLDKNFEPENPKTLEKLDNNTCRWPIGHPDEKDFYFCGRSPENNFSYCTLHVLYAFQHKNAGEEEFGKEGGIPEFIEKKIKSA